MKSNKFEKFDSMVRTLISVPHAEIKKKMEEEKNRKRKKFKKSSASDRVASDRA